ncbi:DUF6542 domain-containing protein [Streptomyces sp. WMMB303]|uniref:DUF6542 domain-containing protein n=1 Tax=Streptomyces sp. WMMB303 TaxID=3034154 RepID=UPI0023EDB4A9|nr:DUF6542 domain-containing protein [Streptomyces sp. WMMB303]MDF4253673.1 hypothetical protein [Streptomyces sp. WMMB303]
MEQRSARTTQHDPYGAPPPGSRAEGGGAATRQSPRLPHPAAPAPAAASAGRRKKAQAPSAPPRGTPRRGAGKQAGGRQRAARGGSARRGASPSAPRLTGLGVGVFATLLMVLIGGLVALMPGGAPAFYGIGFVLVSMAAAVWVRPTELFTAPVAVPLAYTAGLFFAGGAGDGVMGVLQNVFTGLAVHAGWLYAGTLAAVLIALVRRTALALEQRRTRRRATAG